MSPEIKKVVGEPKAFDRRSYSIPTEKMKKIMNIKNSVQKLVNSHLITGIT